MSAQHALVRWARGTWFVRDLGSRNGTFVNGVRLDAGEERMLNLGDTVAFGSQSCSWTVRSVGGPAVFAIGLNDGEQVLADEGMIALPTPENPLATVYQTDQAQWVLDAEHLQPLVDGMVFTVADSAWRFRCVNESETRRQPAVQFSPQNLHLHFLVSSNEEHVEIELRLGRRTMKLPNRAHHYLLFVLAEERVKAAQRGEPEASRGFIDREHLAQMLAKGRDGVAVDIYRLRREFAKAGVEHASTIVEGRTGTSEVRIGCRNITIDHL